MDKVDKVVNSLIEKGKANGFLTFEDMNSILPDDQVTSEKIDNILMTLDEMGIDLIDEADIETRDIQADIEGPLPEEETISIELTCTNRHLPEELRSGDITEPTDSSPPNTSFRNIVKPTATICPPLGKGLHWRLISHLSLNYVSLSDADHFKALLKVYDFQSEQDAQRALAHQRMLDGIVSAQSSFGERMVRGAPLRGTQIKIEFSMPL